MCLEFEKYEEYKNYPMPDEIDKWIESIWELADSIKYETEILNESGFSKGFGIEHVGKEFTYIKFKPESMDEFYCYWQPAMSVPAPLLVHTPGYGAGIRLHPEIVSLGYNVLHISPLGYYTPDGPVESKKRNGVFPVYGDTVETNAEGGYKLWLAECILAIKWAMHRPEVIKDRVSFFGTSQGGGGSLLLGSVYKEKGVRCVAADVPFLTGIPIQTRLRTTPPPYALEGIGENGWKALGFVDTISHTHRLNCPVLLTAGGKDIRCPAPAIKALFERLPGIRSYNYFDQLEHRMSREFIYLLSAWIRMYA